MSITDIIAQAIRVADGDHTLGAGALAEAIITDLDRAGYVIRKKPRSRAAAAPAEPYAPNTGDPAVDAFMRRKHDPKWKPLALPKSPGLPPLRPMKVSEQDAAEAAWNDEVQAAKRMIEEGRQSEAEVTLRTLIGRHRPAWQKGGRTPEGYRISVHRDDAGVQIIHHASPDWRLSESFFYVVVDGIAEVGTHYTFGQAVLTAEKIIANRAERITQ